MNAERKVQFEERDISGDPGAPLLPVMQHPVILTESHPFGRELMMKTESKDSVSNGDNFSLDFSFV